MSEHADEAALVLIVDDESSGRQALEGLLLPEGYRLAFAADGPQALAQAAALRPDVILLDVMMPGMDGFEVCQRLRATPDLAEVPVIIVTALDDRAARLEAIESGADDFVCKPFDRLELRTRVRATVRLNRYRRLLAERERFRWVVDRAREGILLLDASGTPTYANAAARALLGLADDTPLPAVSFLELAQRHYHGDPPAAWTEWPRLADPTQPLYLVRAETHAAPATWLAVDTLTPPESAGATLVRLNDVSARITRRADMHAFRTLISHKLRTPVGHVWAGLDLLMHDDALTETDRRHFTEIAFQGAERLRGTVEHVLREVEALGLAAPGMGFALAALPDATARAAELIGIPDAQVAARVSPAQAERHLALGATAFELVLYELLENARKFHPQHAPHVEVTIDAADGEQARVRVADDGVTLSPIQLRRVWAPYYQGDKDFTGEVPGIGLGLAYVASVLSRIGGQFQLANRADGPGVIVELLLPLEPRPVA